MQTLLPRLLLLALLTGCAGMPADAPPLDAQLSRLGVAAGDVRQRETSLFGVTSAGSKVADLRPSHVLLMTSSLEFITLDKSTASYRRELSLPLSRIENAALVRYGNLGHLRQIHLKSELGLVVMSFGFGETERAEKFFDVLKGTGLQVVVGSGYVRSASDSQGMVPIFIPSR